MQVLDSVRVLEMGGLGPGPFCAMHLADWGGRCGFGGAPARGPGHHLHTAQSRQALGVCRSPKP